MSNSKHHLPDGQYSVEVQGSKSEVRQHQVFGVADRKGREIGAAAWIGVVAFADVPAGHDGVMYCMKPGCYFYYRPFALRAGKAFGAYHYASYFLSAEERDAAVAKYFDGARKRAKAGK